MKELKANTKITTTELREWFGISASSYTKSKEQYWKTLSEYCTFEILSTRFILIKEIKDPNKVTYNKEKINARAKRCILQNYKKYWGPVNTNAVVAAKLFTDFKNEFKNSKGGYYSLGTIANFISEIKNEEIKNEVITQERVWAKIQGPIGKNLPAEELAQRVYIKLTSDEIDYVRKRFNEYFKQVPDVIIDIKHQVAIGELNRADAWDKFEKQAELSNKKYVDFLELISKELQELNPEVQCDWVTRATEIIENAIIKEGEFEL